MIPVLPGLAHTVSFGLCSVDFGKLLEIFVVTDVRGDLWFWFCKFNR